MRYEIWTDGSTKKNGQEGAVGGFAYIIKRGKDLIEEKYGCQQNTTNQRMELLAAISALEALDKHLLGADRTLCDCYLFSDSAYLINCCNQRWYRSWITNGWKNSKKEPVANQDLWERLIPFFEMSNYNFEKVKGHGGGADELSYWNNYVDTLAQRAAGG